MLFSRAAEECIRALAAEGIPSIVLKGLAYEPSIYPGAGTRPTSDVDLLVPNEERRRAFGVLDRMGFEPKAAAPGFDDADYHEVAWTRADVEVDLHLALAPFARCDIDYRAVWAAAVPLLLGATEARALRADHAAVFHALHMAIDHSAYRPSISSTSRACCQRPTTSPPRPSWRAPGAAGGRSRPHGTGSVAAAGVGARRAIVGRRTRAIFPARHLRLRNTASLPRPEQLRRKLQHFDTPRHALRYLLVQSRRNIVELYERRLRRRSARTRLALSDPHDVVKMTEQGRRHHVDAELTPYVFTGRCCPEFAAAPDRRSVGIARVQAAASPGGTRMPSVPELKISLGPPPSDAITTQPRRIASTMVMPKDSGEKDGLQSTTTTRHQPGDAVRNPVKTSRSPSPARALVVQPSAYSGSKPNVEPPTTRKRAARTDARHLAGRCSEPDPVPAARRSLSNTPPKNTSSRGPEARRALA